MRGEADIIKALPILAFDLRPLTFDPAPMMHNPLCPGLPTLPSPIDLRRRTTPLRPTVMTHHWLTASPSGGAAYKSHSYFLSRLQTLGFRLRPNDALTQTARLSCSIDTIPIFLYD